MASRKSVSSKKAPAKTSGDAKKSSSSKKSGGSKKASGSKKAGSSKKAPAKKPAPAKKAAGGKSSTARNVAIAVGAGAVAAAAVVAGRRALRAMKAAVPATCTIADRGDVSGIVIDFLIAQGFPDASEGSQFPDDIPANSNRRKTWWRPLRDAVVARGCKAGTFSPGDCGGAKNVGEIVDALWESVKKANG